MRTFWWILALLPLSLQAQDVIQYQAATESPVSQARYIDGDRDKPAIFILHGFLATYDFPTVQGLQDYFSFAGYPTLAPTLSLGIPLRKSSLNCNSLHTHTLEQDINEIFGWIEWLEQQGHDNIILIGHSSGSQQLLEALGQKQPDSIKAAFLTSLFFLNSERLGIKAEDLAKAKTALQQTNLKPQKYNFLYCQNDYLATPQSYLSYMISTRQRVLELLNKIELPTYSVMGSQDSRYQQVGSDWIAQLQQTRSQVVMIEGANHFFSHDHEPQLHRTILQLIEQLE